ncbi:MAG: hypothetical protein O3B95_09420 [Chloroflexi bacterium]|nr:hypothetical protein [Chloroflexota bacterium]
MFCAAAPEGGEAAFCADLGEGFGRAGLADPGFAGKHHDATAARLRVAERRG